MTPEIAAFLREHARLTRRYFLKFGAAGIAALRISEVAGQEAATNPVLRDAIEGLEPWLTNQDDFRDVSRGNPKPHALSPARREEVGLTRETWTLDIASDPENKARLRRPLTKESNTAFTFADLLQLAPEHAVRFPKIMTCLNLGCPLGNGIWEGVPLRVVLWLTQPSQDLRRVFYYGFHNDDPDQMFRSSLPVGRVLEEPFGLPPVILCYKLNGQWLTPERGGPVRVVVPEAYGFKSIKWLTHVFLSNRWTSNDTYGEQNNDVDSPLKTFCETLNAPRIASAGHPLAITGYAQLGVSGLRKVQIWIHPSDQEAPAGDKHFATAPWRDAEILPPPRNWGGGLADDRIPTQTMGFDDEGRPKSWPMRLTKAHWAILIPGLPAGDYTLRCRTIDGNDVAQPMPRPFRKSGRAAIQEVAFSVE